DRTPHHKARQRVFKSAEKLAETDFIARGATLEENFPIPVFRFDSRAQECFNKWLEDFKNRQISKIGEGAFAEHLAKYPKLMPSLALIFHVIRVAGGDSPSYVSLEDATRAIKLCDYLEDHAKRIYSLVESKYIFKAKFLLEKLQEGMLGDGFTLRDISRKEWKDLKDSNDAKEACKELDERGWIKEKKILPTSKGGASTTRYYVHPILKIRGTSADKTDRTNE
ncbi:MAG: DUF3987 domain-containing protein, partial [Verrucomicrobia bacterium]|nr:DUF3987 domain-containing protein [Verrucomicrobiota bacterium]